MTKIIHNARCSKSRNCFQILEEKGESFEVREYLKKPLDKEELRGILKKLNLPAEKIIRKTEMAKDYYDNKYQVMYLIQRYPNGEEEILEIFSSEEEGGDNEG